MSSSSSTSRSTSTSCLTRNAIPRRRSNPQTVGRNQQVVESQQQLLLLHNGSNTVNAPSSMGDGGCVVVASSKSLSSSIHHQNLYQRSQPPPLQQRSHSTTLLTSSSGGSSATTKATITNHHIDLNTASTEKSFSLPGGGGSNRWSWYRTIVYHCYPAISSDTDQYRYRPKLLLQQQQQQQQQQRRVKRKSDSVVVTSTTILFGIGLTLVGLCSLVLLLWNMYINHSYHNFDASSSSSLKSGVSKSSIRRDMTQQLDGGRDNEDTTSSSTKHPIHHLMSQSSWTGTLTALRASILLTPPVTTNEPEVVVGPAKSNLKLQENKDDTTLSSVLPPPVAPLTEWKNDENVVHVIQTRFMQNQPELIQLGLARLQLLTAITVPSIQYQTQQQFIWIIRTDPQLHPSILQPLMTAIAELPNAILIASNRNPEGFRDGSCISDVTTETLLVGSMEYIQSYYHAGQTHTVLETRCDADDAIAIDFVELIQKSATSGLYPLHDNDWIVYCADNHMEWQFDNPWADGSNEKIEPSVSNNSSAGGAGVGSNTINRSTDDAAAAAAAAGSSKERGALLVLRSGHCVTPGLTWGYSVNATRKDIPVSQHHKIQKSIKACGSRYYHDTEQQPPLQSKCLIKLGGDFPLALRARTPTSAGMDHVFMTNQTEHTFPMQQLHQSKARTLQDELWSVLFVLFGVNGDDLYNVRTYISDHLTLIARDALAGQCTKGHSCKHSSKELLQQLLNTVDDQKLGSNQSDQEHL